MARYIDADETIELLKSLGSRDYRREKGTICDAIKMLQYPEYTPTADVVPKSEVENIFADIETCMKDFEDDDDGYLLKKCEFEFFMREIKEKYAGQKNGRANSEM